MEAIAVRPTEGMESTLAATIDMTYEQVTPSSVAIRIPVRV